MSKENDNSDKTIKVLCDDARRHIAEVLPQLVDKMNARALGQKLDDNTPDVSLPHAKFIVDLAESLGVWKHDDKKSKTVDESTAAASLLEQELEFRQDVLKKLDERTVRSPEHNSAAVK